MNISDEVDALLYKTIEYARENHHEYVLPEHLLYSLSHFEAFISAFTDCGGNVVKLRSDLVKMLKAEVMVKEDSEPQLSEGFKEVLINAQSKSKSSEKYVIEIPHILSSLLELKESYARYYIDVQGIDVANLLYLLCKYIDETMYEDYDDEEDDTAYSSKTEQKYENYVVCMNDSSLCKKPLIGREDELSKTIMVLSRCDKNNPLHIGEPGVGKTAITYGLANLINEGKVPDNLKDAKIFSLDLSGLLGGTQFRGDFEKRVKEVLDSIKKEKTPIVYIDEIHNIVGAGATNGGSFDASNMLKPYLTDGHIRFIGATTYEEYKKYFSKNKSLVRRFQNIDIKEPSREETLKILEGLKKHYESFHSVKYGKDVLEYTVDLSIKYMNDRFLPDKAIDLLDEAGAYRKIHPTDKKSQMVNKDVIDEVLSLSTNVPKNSINKDETLLLKNLNNTLSKEVFGQDEAIKEVSNAIKYSRAGILDDYKPMASLLFVGPTGVGKTEIAKKLAESMGIKLIRFDMSEYQEKHGVAKLIGAPAGYVGYEEGGILTEEIRKNPYSVLLLDEIEKAHSDIYNILLQVMDYATLTDNQGRKADFRNVIIIMTSNAGASKLNKEAIGFNKHKANTDEMLNEVKRVFQPEFRNRLTKIVVFNGIDDNMATLITKKKINQLVEKLKKKNVEMTVDTKAIEYIKQKGVSKEYGAREIDRVINSEVKPLLVDRLLFGNLKKGGVCNLSLENDSLKLL